MRKIDRLIGEINDLRCDAGPEREHARMRLANLFNLARLKEGKSMQKKEHLYWCCVSCGRDNRIGRRVCTRCDTPTTLTGRLASARVLRDPTSRKA